MSGTPACTSRSRVSHRVQERHAKPGSGAIPHIQRDAQRTGAPRTGRASGPAESLGLIADLLYALGLAVWTGTVVVVLIEIIPEAKERQILAAIDAYEAAMKRDAPKGRT